MKLGDRLTGWVAEHQQPIINSEAKLDLGPEAAFVGLRYCMSLPLVSDGQLAGVLSLYARSIPRRADTEAASRVAAPRADVPVDREARGWRYRGNAGTPATRVSSR